MLRKDVATVWTRRFPVSKQPETIGEHLRKRRFGLGIRQSEAAQKLGVSDRTLSLWECDRVYPAWAHQAKLAVYLDFDPFDSPELGKPKGNESPFVAFLSPEAPVTTAQQIKQRRFKLKKTRRQLALELGISVKTLWGWETNRWTPSNLLWKRIAKVLGFDPTAEAERNNEE